MSHSLPNMSEFLEHLRPSPLRLLFDRMQGITPGRRLELDKKHTIRDAEVSAVAYQALGKLTEAEVSALQEYWDKVY